MPRWRKTTSKDTDTFPFCEYRHVKEWEDDEFEGEISKRQAKSKSSEEMRDNYTPLGNALF